VGDVGERRLGSATLPAKAERPNLTLYYYGYDKDSVAERGFEERTPLAWQKEKEPSGIELMARRPRLTSWERVMKLELPEDLLLPYEWAQESDWYWRTFRVPAALLNSVRGLL
jgi:hypothetical protein